ncbi:RHS repeat-associated core domain-containing protein [Leptospira sp. WS58.C1]|uniref:RHS repeat-associated core domain-containing protein n=1 Tax=Leptospira cinconiae TaxID=3235173 RepID=UPI00349E9276
MNKHFRKASILIFLPLFSITAFGGFSVKSFFLRLTGSLVPQPLPKLSATHSGTLTSTVEIVLPPGTKGIIPNLSLSYASGGKNGILGVGWEIAGIYSISRDPSFGINFDGNDNYLSDQVGSLVDISGNKTKYHSRKESWIQFVPSGVCGTGPCSWTATDKDGITYSYGKTNDSRIEALGKNGSIRSWALNQVRDPFGNGYDITYIEDSVNGEYYPDEIKYQNRNIKFEYSDSRSDVYPSYSFGSLVKTSKRLDSIEIYADSSLLRNYQFEYSNGPTTGRSVLSSLKRSESNIFGSESYDDLEFSYGSDEFSLQPALDTNLNTPTASMNLFVPSGLLLYANLYFGNPLPTQPTATEKRLATYLQYAMHFPVPDRDSCNNGPSACLCAAYAPCWGGNPNFLAYLASICLDYNNWGGPTYCASGIESGLTYWAQMDLDGNGIIDFASIVGSETSNTIRLRAWKVQNGNVDPNGSFLSPVLPLHYNTFFQVADLDGDGRTDFVYETGGKLSVIYSKSDSFSEPVSFSNVAIPAANRNMQTFKPYSYFYEYSSSNPKRMTSDKAQTDWFADMNSDNLVDFIHYDGSKFNIYLNQKGSFSNAIQVTGTSSYFINDFIDLDADGKSEYVRLVQYSQNPQYTAINNQLLDANEQAETVTNEFHTKEDTLNSILVSGASSVSNSDFYSLIDYYLKGCSNYISNSELGYSIDDIVLVPNSSGENIACIQADPNYIDITQLQAARTGTLIPSSNTLLNDLQVIYASLIGPITTTQTNLQNQLNALNASANGTIRYRLDVTSFNLTSKTSNTIQYDLGTSADRLRSFFGDVNSDGLPDFITIVGNQIKVSLNTNNGFSGQVVSTLNATDGSKVSQFNFSDVNSDGLEDLVLYNKATQTVETYLSNGSGALTYNANFNFGQFTLNEQTTNGVYKADQGQFIIQDLNGDGSKDALLIKLWQDKTQGHVIARTANPKLSDEDDLLSITNGSQTATAEYTTKQLHSGAIQVGSGDYPNLPDTSNSYIVKSITTDLGSGILMGENFEYKNARIYIGSRELIRSLGFASVKETDTESGFYELTEYNQADYRLAGIPIISSNYNSSGKLMQQTVYSGFQFPNPFGTELAVYSNISKSSYHNGILEISKNEELSYDTYGFPKTQTETSGDYSSVRVITYTHDIGNWRIGRVTRSKKLINNTLVQDQLVSYTQDRVDSLTQFAGTNAEQSISFAYDTFGNPITITDPLGFATTFAYDPVLNLFPIQKTNPLGHVTKIEYETSLGVEVSKIDPNGGSIKKTYDVFGKLLTITFPGNSEWNESYEYANTGKYNLNDLSSNESITKIIRDTSSNVETRIIQYVDPFGKVIKTISDTATSGITLIEDTVYDYSKGVVSKKSKPYFNNLSPFWINYQYDDPDNRVTGSIAPDLGGNIISKVTYNGLTTVTEVQYPDGKVDSISETKNELGQVISKSQNGKTILTNYAPNGQPSSIIDPLGRTTNFVYDLGGRRVSVSDQNTGNLSFIYDKAGRIIKQTDARGKSLSHTYDAIGRVLSTTPSGGELPVRYSYDDNSIPNSIGYLSKITDESGTTEFSYNLQGKPVLQRKVIDGLPLFYAIDYDSLGRSTVFTYPDGTKVHNEYSANGNLKEVTMDYVDGTKNGITVAQYEGPIFIDGNPTFRKTLGNGVVTDTIVNSVNFRTTQLISKKENNSVLSDLSYAYDGVGNITAINDNYKSINNQKFSYDNYNRVIQALGSYGSEKYVYGDDGNLLQKGEYNFGYSDSNHANAVTRVYSPNAGETLYSYDDSGNMISRNGDTLRYDSYGRMIEANLADGDRISYTYDYAGNRLKAKNEKAHMITYYFDDLYEIVKAPGVSSKHTLYIKGFQGEILTQITRENVTLRESFNIHSVNSNLLSGNGSLLDKLQPCSGVGIDCGEYWKNRFISPISDFFSYSRYFHSGIPTVYSRVSYIFFILFLLYISYPLILKGNEILTRMKLLGFSTPVLLISVFSIFILEDCNWILRQGGYSAPWYLITNQSSNEDVSPIAPGRNSNAGVPAVGTYFYQTDHLGSTTMLTDGHGNQVPGPGQSGVSSVSYKPYGEINYTQSSGPDIFRYKYSGQISDGDTGLYYYKSRYYDSLLGRFIQADDQSDKGLNGLNRYMLVGGNPINRIDPNGHSWLSSALGSATGWLKKLTFAKFTRLNSVNLGLNKISWTGISNGLKRSTFVNSTRIANFEKGASIAASAVIGIGLGIVAGSIAGFLAGAVVGGPFGAIAGAALGGTAGAIYGATQGHQIFKYLQKQLGNVKLRLFIKGEMSISCGGSSNGPVPHCDVEISPPTFMFSFTASTGIPGLDYYLIVPYGQGCNTYEGRGGDEEGGDGKQHTEGLDCP